LNERLRRQELREEVDFPSRVDARRSEVANETEGAWVESGQSAREEASTAFEEETGRTVGMSHDHEEAESSAEAEASTRGKAGAAGSRRDQDDSCRHALFGRPGVEGMGRNGEPEAVSPTRRGKASSAGPGILVRVTCRAS
jgi:hypothetical protein